MLEMMTDGEFAVVADGAWAAAVAAAVARGNLGRNSTKRLSNCSYYCHYSYCNGCTDAAAMHSVRRYCLATGHDAVAVT